MNVNVTKLENCQIMYRLVVSRVQWRTVFALWLVVNATMAFQPRYCRQKNCLIGHDVHRDLHWHLRNLPATRRLQTRKKVPLPLSTLEAAPHLMLLQHEAFRSASSLAIAASLGRAVGGDASILVTLGSAAMLSNTFGWAPITSPLYDACWRYFLPGSLVLLLLSLVSSSPGRKHEDDATNNDFSSRPLANTEHDENTLSSFSSTNKEITESLASVRKMGLPFLIASLASFFGCLVSMALSRLFWSSSSTLLPRPDQALAALSCLLASFIGGSVNFMATSRIIGTPSSTTASSAQRASNVSGSLLSAMAAADLLVMAVYFGVLGAAVNSTRLRTWVMNIKSDNSLAVTSNNNPLPATRTSSLKTQQQQTKLQTKNGTLIKWQQVRGSIVCLGVAGLMVEFAHCCESFLSTVVPGTACGILAILTPLIRRFIPKKDLATASFWSEFSFLTLFASIGLTAHMGSALHAGPGCLLLSLAALVIHVLFLLLVTAIWNRICSAKSIITLDTALIASNAAIGGPATAAAWAGRTAPQWALAATIWGVVGYATGTTVGVWFYRAVGHWLAL